jgi:hypothetical protein
MIMYVSNDLIRATIKIQLLRHTCPLGRLDMHTPGVHSEQKLNVDARVAKIVSLLFSLRLS